jgi:uncharacterized protein YndB with AHSA1/START domain
MEDFGTLERQGDQTTLRYERHYPRSIEKVWAALTIPERLSDWLGAAIVEPHVGGRFELFVDRPSPDARSLGRILTWEPPTLLEFSWKVGPEPETTVRCDLTATAPNATKLIFAHGKMAFRWVGLVLPGWHTHLERLSKTVESETAEPEPPGRWRELQGIYVEHYNLKDVLIDPPAGHCS